MEFSLSQEQKLLQQSLKRFFEDRQSGAGQPPEPETADDCRTSLAQLGVLGTLVSESLGGSGLSLLDAALVGEEIGRACAPISWHSAGVMAPLALAEPDIAADAPAGRWLSALARGEALIGTALSSGLHSNSPDGPQYRDGKLTGMALMATDTPGAQAWVVEADDKLWLVEADAPGLQTTAMQTIDRLRAFGSLQLDGTPATPLPRLQPAQLVQVGRIALAAETLGAAEHMLYRAVAYACERQQFDRVIGSFQSIKHLCADMAAELEPARALIWQAAHSWDLDSEEAPWLACHARAVMAEAGTFIARTATEVHGGIGFTEEYGLHAWFKRIGCNRQLLGGPERVREEAARLQGWA